MDGRYFDPSQLMENLQYRNMVTEAKRLTEKWSKHGLLKGLDGKYRDNMAVLLENQAKSLIQEANTVGGDLRGFQQVAFPIVRRVFGNLIANELVSVQPMSLPNGLIFYFDFTYGTNVGLSTNPTYTSGQSVYGQPSGSNIQYGANASGGMYDLLGNAYSMYMKTSTALVGVASGTFGNSLAITTGSNSTTTWGTVDTIYAGDPAFSGTSSDFPASRTYQWAVCTLASITDGTSAVTPENIDTVKLHGPGISDTVRSVTQVGTFNATTGWTRSPSGAHVLFLVSGTTGTGNISASYATKDALDVASADGSVVTLPAWESTNLAGSSVGIPEIDIKVESTSVTAQSRKLRARWTPEVSQDLNAYQNVDTEVELTQILSEHIALEIDNEILSDLLSQAATNYYWSKIPGNFVNKLTGMPDRRGTFVGTTYEWYQRLVETVIDVSNTIHRKILRGAGNFIVTSPDICTILESTTVYKPDTTFSEGKGSDKFSMGAEQVGKLSSRFTVYKDPYFPRSKMLIGYKGNSFLETGYVYAPYVPLIVTPVIYQPDDFTPRKGVMTRYGKKMIRADYYGTVTVLDLNI